MISSTTALRALTNRIPGPKQISALFAFIALSSAQADPPKPDPLLAAGEQALIGFYRLDNVLLSTGKLVTLNTNTLLFQGMGDTPEQAVEKGLLTQTQSIALKNAHCTMTILPDHTLVITNLPSIIRSKPTVFTVTWSIQIYHVFDTYGYRISLRDRSTRNESIRAKFYNADKPNPHIVDIFHTAPPKDTVVFRFVKIANTSPFRTPLT